MARRSDDPIVAAILAEIDVVNRVLGGLHVPVRCYDDLRQEVTIGAWEAALRGRLEWQSPPAVRALLRITTARAAWDWYAHNPQGDELLERDEPTVLDAERLYLGREALAFLRRSTTPERWKAIAAYAKGIPVAEIARRERVPVPTVYNWIRLAREDIAAALARDAASVYVRRKM